MNRARSLPAVAAGNSRLPARSAEDIVYRKISWQCDANCADRLHLRIPRPHQHWIRAAPDEAMTWPSPMPSMDSERVLFRQPICCSRCRATCCWKRSARACPSAHHGAMGPHLRGDCLRSPRPGSSYANPAAAGHVRSRLLPRQSSCIYVLVSEPAPRPCDGTVPVRHADLQSPGRPAVGNDHEWHGGPWAACMAGSGCSRRRPSDRSAGVPPIPHAAGQAGPGSLAERR